jgi:hypothetical protein
MTTFEYVAVLISIIVGLGITHVLAGIGRVISTSGRVQVYWVHVAWTFYLFVYFVAFWWWEFQLSTVEEWTVQLYLFLVLYATLLYLLCVILYPSELPSDLRDYYFSRRKWFFGLWIAVYLVDVADTALKGGAHLVSFGLEYPASILVYIALFVVAMRSTDERFHGAFAVGACIYQLYQFSWTPRLFGAAP